MTEIQKRLFALVDEEYRAFSSSLMPEVDPETIIGVRTPELRRLGKELDGSREAEELLRSAPHRYYEENNLHAFLIERCKDFERCIELTDAFLPYVDNWATCDLCSPRCFAKNTDALLEHIRRWTASDKTYTVRFGVGMLMRYYLDDKFRPEYLNIVTELRSGEYYVNMMRAWFFATALAKQYDAALPYIEQRRLDTWTHNKAIQKAVESRRITPEQKAYLKTLKVKQT